MPRLSKTHQDYWKTRLRKQKIPKSSWDSSAKKIDWEIYIQYRGQREWFNLRTPNKVSAATKAQQIYISLVSNGWEKTRELFKPEMHSRKISPTIGEFLEEIHRKSGLRESTFAVYAQKFRFLVAGAFKISSDNSRHDYVNGGNLRWREKIESIKLHRLTPQKVQVWKIAYLKNAGEDPISQKKARQSVNSILRNAKSLFSSKYLRFIDLELPEILPFEGIEFERAGTTKYKSKIDPEILLEAAQRELKLKQPELFKIFLLALATGLRRKEIDGLLWEQLDFERNKIYIETHLYTEVKTKESEDVIDVDPEIMRLLKQFKQDDNSEFVICSKNKPLPKPVSYARYRCNTHFKSLVIWLKSKGISSNKPIHALRKEFGSVLAAKYGIYAASLGLRHSTVKTTESYYTGQKQAYPFPIGKLLHQNK